MDGVSAELDDVLDAGDGDAPWVSLLPLHPATTATAATTTALAQFVRMAQKLWDDCDERVTTPWLLLPTPAPALLSGSFS